MTADDRPLARGSQGAQDGVVTVQICEIFASIQGEGSAQGCPCTFVRLAGCPLRCRWCDTAYAREGGETMTVDEVVGRVRELGLPLVELTGGEPLAQAATPALATALLDAGLDVMCETSGAFDISVLPTGVRRIMDIKAPGSGEGGRMMWSNLEQLTPTDDVKLVLADRRDYVWARDVVQRHQLEQRCPILLSAAAPLLEPAELAAWILEDRLPVRLQLQLHKVLWPGEERGR